MATNEDRDTQEALTEGQELTNMAQSKGWAIAREMLVQKILDLQNIHNVEDTDASIDKVIVDIKSRKAAVAVLYEWLKQVEGRIEQHKVNTELAADPNARRGDDDSQYIEIQRK